VTAESSGSGHDRAERIVAARGELCETAAEPGVAAVFALDPLHRAAAARRPSPLGRIAAIAAAGVAAERSLGLTTPISVVWSKPSNVAPADRLQVKRPEDRGRWHG